MSSNNKDTTSPPPKDNSGSSSIPGSSSTPGSSLAPSDKPKSTRKLPHPEIKINSQKSNLLAPNIDEPKGFPLGFALENDDDDDGIVDDGSKRDKNGADYLTYEQILKDDAEMEDLKKRLRMRSFLFQKKVEAQKLANYFKVHNPSVLIPARMMRPLVVSTGLLDHARYVDEHENGFKNETVQKTPGTERPKVNEFKVAQETLKRENRSKQSKESNCPVVESEMTRPPFGKILTGKQFKSNLPPKDMEKGEPSGK